MKNNIQLGFENTLWAAADKLRGQMDTASYKHIVLGFIFLKYISDVRSRTNSSSIIKVPNTAYWNYIDNEATSDTIGNLIDDGMRAIEHENPVLIDILPKNYSQLLLDKRRLLELFKLFNNLDFVGTNEYPQDVLGRVYEYFLGHFAQSEGQRGGEFYTPQSIVQLLVEMLAPYEGKVYDPCCGSGGLFIQGEKFVKAHGKNEKDISVYGQESNPDTWKLAKMNLILYGIYKANLGNQASDSFNNDLHPDLRADYILANPPFNMSDWGRERLKYDIRWKFGLPSKNNANFAWVQHIIHHLSDNGFAGFVLANGSMSVSQGGDGKIRRNIIEADLVDCIVALAGNLFYSTQIPVCLWFLSRNKSDKRFRDRRGETLFINARSFGQMTSRVHRILTPEEITLIVHTYHTWRGDFGGLSFEDIPGYAKSATIEEIKRHKFALVPGRYVGFARENKKWDINLLQSEFHEIENRIISSHTTAESALATLRELING